MINTAIILAAGQGQRYGGKIPKQFSEINGFPLIWYSFMAFIEFDPSIDLVLVIDRAQINFWHELCKKVKIDISHKVILGGKSRSESVKHALHEIGGEGIVYIHDAARPCLNTMLLQKIKNGVEKFGNAIPVIPESNALRIKRNNSFSAFNRNDVVIVQTPQAFRICDIKKAYEDFFTSTASDDAEIAEKSGIVMNHVEGEVENIKVTYSFDLELADVILRKRKA